MSLLKLRSASNLLCRLSSRLYSKSSKQAEIDREVEHHSKIADDWWDKNGCMGALHALNEIRVPFIRDGIIARGNVHPDVISTTRVLSGQRIMECGCGGGILTEQLGRLGANVTGIDLSEKLINSARLHLETQETELKQLITYKIEPMDVHANEHVEYYDAVIVSEVIEHVEDKVDLLSSCVRALKPTGSIFVTSLSKTAVMWLAGIAIGEYLLKTVPQNTHHWEKMISPVDVQRILDSLNCCTILVNGSTYDFWRNTWKWIHNTNMCYALQAIKKDI